MAVSRGSHAARRGPQPGRRIIEFRARENAGGIPPLKSPSDEHLAVGQERRRMVESRGSHAARRGPQPGRRIVEFALASGAAGVIISPVTSTWPLGRSVAV